MHHSISKSYSLSDLKLISNRNRRTSYKGGQLVHRSSIMKKQSQPKVVTGDHGYVLEDVPHLTDYIPNLPVCYFFFLDIFKFIFDFFFFF